MFDDAATGQGLLNYFLRAWNCGAISENDLARRNTIANLLAEWGLLTLVDPQKSVDPLTPLNRIKIISYGEKGEWNLVAKIGRALV